MFEFLTKIFHIKIARRCHWVYLMKNRGSRVGASVYPMVSYPPEVEQKSPLKSYRPFDPKKGSRRIVFLCRHGKKGRLLLVSGSVSWGNFQILKRFLVSLITLRISMVSPQKKYPQQHYHPPNGKKKTEKLQLKSTKVLCFGDDQTT